MGRPGAVAAIALFAATLPTSVAAQRAEARAGDAGLALFGPPSPPPQERAASPVAPAALSLLLPGAGQHVLGQRRKWVYAALEVAGWAVFIERRSAGGDYRNRYRDFAWMEGRLQSGPRMDGDFEYYETMSKWTSSGAFDTDGAQLGVQPEMDPVTYNGSIWDRATQIYLAGGSVPTTDPAYRSALAYYQARAYGNSFLWDWSSVPGGETELADLIEASDDRFRQATTALGVVIANHLISAADAFVSARGRAAPARIRIVPSRYADGAPWAAVLSVSVGR